jgi:hypothetical protein
MIIDNPQLISAVPYITHDTGFVTSFTDYTLRLIWHTLNCLLPLRRVLVDCA